MNEALMSRLKGIFSEILSEEQLASFNMDSTMDNTEGWDSLNFLNVVLGLESEFGLRIDGLDAANLVSVANIVAYLEQHTEIANDA